MSQSTESDQSHARGLLAVDRDEVIQINKGEDDGGNQATVSTGVIGSLFDGLITFLKLMLETLKKGELEPPPRYWSLEGNLAPLFFWGKDFNVSNGELDIALQHSIRLRDTVLTVLISIGEFMSQCLVQILSLHTEREDILRSSNITPLIKKARIALKEPEEPGQYTHHGIEDVCLTLRTKIENLHLLSSSLECPAEDIFDGGENKDSSILKAKREEIGIPAKRLSLPNSSLGLGSCGQQVLNIDSKGFPPTQQTFLFAESSKSAKSSRQGRRNARSFVMQKARRERPWSTNKHASEQRKRLETKSQGAQYFSHMDSNTLSGVTQEICPECQIFLRRPGQPLCPRCLLLQPSTISNAIQANTLRVYNEFTLQPFQSIGKSLDPFRAMFQAHHHTVSVEELKFHFSRAFGTKAMYQYWIPTLLKSPHAFLSTLCIASVHLDAVKELPNESTQTTALRQEVIHLINQNLASANSQVDDFNIIAVTQLIASEIIACQDTSLSLHESGVEAMIKQRGGLNQLGVNGLLASTISCISLESAILHEEKSRAIYSDFCSSQAIKPYSDIGITPISPLWGSHDNLHTLRRSAGCNSRALDLLNDIRLMIDLFVHLAKNSRQNTQSLKNLHKKIAQYPSAAELEKNSILNSRDWKYEVIRVASLIQATAIIKCVPLSEALQYCAQQNPKPKSASNEPSVPAQAGPTALLKDLKIAIQNSDISDCWDDMAGVLLWVSLTVGAASRKSDKVLRQWFSALVIRTSLLLCFQHPEAIYGTLLRMSKIIEWLGYSGSDSSSLDIVRGKSAGGWRRKSFETVDSGVSGVSSVQSAPEKRQKQSDLGHVSPGSEEVTPVDEL